MSMIHVRRTEPKPDELFIELRKLQQAKKDLEDELMETMLLRSTRMEEEDALNAEALHLEGLLNEKEEINRSLQLTCEDFKQKAQRQLEQNHQKEELMNQYCCQIEETKLKHRKIRMKFQNQLLQLMEQHKSLSTVFTPQRLPAEIESAVYTTEQLLKAEQQKLEQLTKLLGRLSHTQTGEMQMDTSDKAS
ncbi:synaptonemal complex central element protein 1 isoform X2 [Myxocyprinus asiaticus]|uniref:synaptonemal complex central element protein 1 isoform X2 n=1 Tax=Myxocyprinus asiaticus TaxID=70543 RepID=UPI0022233F0C|nr:synaptonemal complex central element protein 1 isoform X2 [Myxocyprinus asiaticus]